MTEILVFPFYTVYFVDNTNEVETLADGTKEFVHDTSTQFYVVNKLLSTVERKCESIGDAASWASAMSEKFGNILNGKDNHVKAPYNFSKELESRVNFEQDEDEPESVIDNEIEVISLDKQRADALRTILDKINSGKAILEVVK